METRGSSPAQCLTIHDMAGMQIKEVVVSEEQRGGFWGLPCGTYTISFRGSDGNVFSNTLVILRS